MNYNKNRKKIFIEALEQRIMLDGAGASTFLDIIDDRNQDKFLQKNSKKITKFSENKIDDQSQKLPFDQVTRDQKRNERKQVVFIDSQVQDYQTLINAFNKDTEVHLIQSNEDGFKKIDSVLKDNYDVSSLHIIGHGSAGKILFGNAILSNDTIQSYNQTLRSIGQCLTEDGDILFYGCNVASTDGGKTLISKISEITKADIAASDDVTGKSGDWKLEIKVGHIDTKNINQIDYQHDLTMYRTASAATSAAEVTVGADGITSIRGAMAAFTGTADRNAFDFKSSRDHNPGSSHLYQDYYLTYNSGTFGTGDNSDANKVDRFTVVLEKTGITSGSLVARRPDHPGTDNSGSATTGNLGQSAWENSMHDIEINTTDSADYKLSATAPNSTTGPMDVYMVALDSHFSNNSDRYSQIAEVVFDREIIGLLIDGDQTYTASSNTGNVDLHNSNNSTYPDPLNNSNRGFETIKWRYFRNNYSNGQWDYGTGSSSTNGDWFAVGGTDNRTLHVAAKNTGGGDYVRVLVKGQVANSDPVAVNDTDAVNEDATVTQSSGSGLLVADDTDADSDALTVTAIKTGGEGLGATTSVSAGSSYNSSGTSITGTYGTLTLGADGTYTYTADQNAADLLDASDTVTDTFTYTISDGTATDTATLIITVTGVNDAPVAVNDTDAVNEDATVTQSSGSSLVMADDTDADDSASITVTQIAVTGGSNSAVSGGSSYNSSGTSITGTYGTLVIGADGTYTYTADQSAADDLDASDTVTDSFTYTISDGTATDTATLIITVTGVNDAPVAQNDVGHIVEGGTLTVDDGDNANVSGSYDATGEHSGDVINTSSGSHSDSDADDSASLVVSAIRTGGSEGSGTAGTLGSGLSGTYGTLTMNANGSYTYVAGQVSGSGGTDVFNYTLSDGTATDIATLTITIYNNNAPVARNDVGVISEDATLTVSNSDNANVSGSYDATGEHSGDVLQTSSTTHYDTDADSDTLVVASVRTGSTEGSGTAGSLGSALTGTYGQLTLNANGSYTYVANQSAADVLDTGDTASDVFNYTVSDGNGRTDTATITITVLGVEDAPTAGNETIYINENNTDATHGTRTSGNTTHTFADADFTNYTDPDDDVGIKIKSLPSTGTLTKISNGAEPSVNDTITNMSNLLYTPDANSEADDSFTFRAYDGTSVEGTTYTMTISVNAAPVAVSDTASITAGDSDATGNVITNDTDSDDATSVMTIKGVGAGAEASTLPNSNVGSSVEGTYGNLTITSAGAYTYSVSDNSNTIALDAGETATDIFSYKVRDDETNAGSKALDIGIITFTVTGIDGDSEPGKPDDDEKKETKKDKKESKQQRKEEKKAKKKAKRDRKLLAKKFDLPKSSLVRKSEFNQGLKLVDLVAESKSIEIREKDIYVDKVKAKYSEEGLKVKFKVFNDEGKEVQKYYGTMKDGSPLPKWIQVDPKTGKTKTDIPKGVKMVEFKIVAIDEDNNRKQVTVIIDAKKIAKDKEVLKQTRKLTKEKTIEVKNDGVVKLNSIDKDGSIDKTTTNAINDSQSFEDIIQTIEPDEFLKLESNLENNDYVADLPASIHFLIKNDLKTNFENLTIVLKDGKELPSWIKFDKESGKIISNPPKDVNSVDLKIIIKDPAGETIVKDLKINYSKENKSTSEKILDTDNGFITLSAQLSKEHANWDNYGSQLIDSL